MKEIIIIGAGGMGREMYNIVKACIDGKNGLTVKGFIDDNLHALDGFKNYPILLSTIKDYKPGVDDYFVCSIGDVATKRMIVNEMELRGAKFITLIHPLAVVHTNVEIGEGTIVDKFAVIGADSKIGKHCLIQIDTVVGHDVTIGDYTRIDCHCTLVGGVGIGSAVCVHTSSVINHKVTIGDGAMIGAMSFVIRKVKAGTAVQGNPAKKIEY